VEFRLREKGRNADVVEAIAVCLVQRLEDLVDDARHEAVGITSRFDRRAERAHFLGTLSGDQPKVSYPILPTRTKDTPRPQ
jgi:cytochrome c peroxidase